MLGIVPLSFTRDRGGPICRTVEDTAILLEVLAGWIGFAMKLSKQLLLFERFSLEFDSEEVAWLIRKAFDLVNLLDRSK